MSAEVDVSTLLLCADHDLRDPVAIGDALRTRELRRFLRSVEPH